MRLWTWGSASPPSSNGFTRRKFAAFRRSGDITAFLSGKSTGCCSEREARTEKERKLVIRRVSGRNQLVGRIGAVRISGLMAEVEISIGGQQITSIITARSAREMQLKPGQTAAALIKATEVMILRI